MQVKFSQNPAKSCKNGITGLRTSILNLIRSKNITIFSKIV